MNDFLNTHGPFMFRQGFPYQPPVIAPDSKDKLGIAPGVVLPALETPQAHSWTNNDLIFRYASDAEFNALPPEEKAARVRESINASHVFEKIKASPFSKNIDFSFDPLGHLYMYLGRVDPEIALEHVRRDQLHAGRKNVVAIFKALPDS